MAKVEDNDNEGGFDMKVIFQAIAIGFAVVVYIYLFCITVFNI